MLGGGKYLPAIWYLPAISQATLMACLHFCLQIKRNPSFKKFFYKPSVSSLRKLAATLRSQGAHATEPQTTYPFVFGLGNQCAGNNYLTGLHYRRLSYGQFPYEEAQQVRTGHAV